MRRQVQYQPPHAQAPKLRELPVREQWEWLNRFFSRCTNTTPFGMGATVQINHPVEARDREDLASAVAETVRLFGNGKFEEDPGESGEGTWEWEITARQAEAAIDFIARGEPWATTGPRPVSISFLTVFKLRDPATGTVLPHQLPRRKSSIDHSSYLIGAVGPSPWIIPHFAFPFPRVTAQFLKYLTTFSAELPFKLAPRHFRSVRPATATAREHIGFLSPEDDERIRDAQLRHAGA